MLEIPTEALDPNDERTANLRTQQMVLATYNNLSQSADVPEHIRKQAATNHKQLLNWLQSQ